MPAGVLTEGPGRPGFFGKLPWLGDFVTRDLPVSFVTPWDGWLQAGMAATRDGLGEAWVDRFLTAPIWRFLLPAGCAGPAMAGVLMPSVDRVGRSFPLTIAAEGADRGDAFLDAAEAIGREAISHDLAPEEVIDRLRQAPLPPAPEPDPAGQGARWWSEGGPLAAAAELRLDALPDSAGFARMLGR